MMERPDLVAQRDARVIMLGRARPARRRRRDGPSAQLSTRGLLITAPRVIPAAARHRGARARLRDHVARRRGHRGRRRPAAAARPTSRSARRAGPRPRGSPGQRLLRGRVRAGGRGGLGHGRPAGCRRPAPRRSCPRSSPRPVGELAAALRATAALRPGLPRGARVLGVHAEGPFICARPQGRPQRGLDHRPTPGRGRRAALGGPGLLRLVTLAPERDGALAAIARLTEAGVLVSVGHSDATAVRWPRPLTPAPGWSRTCSTRSARCTTASPAWSARRWPTPGSPAG